MSCVDNSWLFWCFSASGGHPFCRRTKWMYPVRSLSQQRGAMVLHFLCQEIFSTAVLYIHFWSFLGLFLLARGKMLSHDRIWNPSRTTSQWVSNLRQTRWKWRRKAELQWLAAFPLSRILLTWYRTMVWNVCVGLMRDIMHPFRFAYILLWLPFISFRNNNVVFESSPLRWIVLVIACSCLRRQSRQTAFWTSDSLRVVGAMRMLPF